jgi:CheY-like chemotaxis protein
MDDRASLRRESLYSPPSCCEACIIEGKLMTDERPILLVDDDFDIRETLAELLRERGYSVVTAAHGQEALDILRRPLRPCLILLDLMMPVMDGYEFLDELAKDPALASLPVIVITAGASLGRQRINRPVMSKPFNLNQLMASVARHC